MIKNYQKVKKQHNYHMINENNRFIFSTNNYQTKLNRFKLKI